MPTLTDIKLMSCFYIIGKNGLNNLVRFVLYRLMKIKY